MTKRIFRSILLVVIPVLLAGLIIISGVMYSYLTEVQEAQMLSELSLAAAGVEQKGTDYLSAVRSKDFRLTYVSSDGTVIFDTESQVSNMDNHANREEIKEALLGGSGKSSRYSATLTEQTLYYAKKLSNGNVLRISIDRASVLSLLLGVLQPIAFIFLVAIILSVIIANRISKKIVMPLNELDLDEPMKNDVYDEISPLLNRIHRQHKQISMQEESLRRKAEEFDQITSNMQEGLILLDSKNTLMSVNSAALRIFDRVCFNPGDSFLTLDRSHELRDALAQAEKDGYCETFLSRDSKEYRVNISRIDSDDKPAGYVILLSDITDKISAERSRREFTANVSHELKTPLQSIIGYSELLSNGMVKPQDIPTFTATIYKEATRLVSLIDDIIRLSQLDEGVQMQTEDISLMLLAQDIIDQLSSKASEKNVSITIEGENVDVRGQFRLLSEILFNLCDNAIKYNRQNGNVTIKIWQTDQDVCFAVSDNGIGIPKEHHSRIFERFYRVDKSHSRQSGGTGLGLSIVKHAVAFHNGKITLESVPDEGTTVTVSIPK